MNLKLETWVYNGPTYSYCHQNPATGHMKPYGTGRSKSFIRQVKMPEPIRLPPFVTGGFVGSKSAEHHNASFEFSLVDALFSNPSFLKTFSHLLGENICQLGAGTIFDCNSSKSRQNSLQKENTRAPREPKSYAEALRQTSTSPVLLGTAKNLEKIDINISSKKVDELVQTSKDVSEPKIVESESVIVPVCENEPGAVSRTVSECSDQSWAMLDDQETSHYISNPWLRTIMGRDLDDSDDSDEDYVYDEDEESETESDEEGDLSVVEDMKSENGEVVDVMKWSGEILSPITSPLPETENTSSAHDEYESDDSEGFLICCGPVEDDIDALEAEKRQAEERIRKANARWQRSLEQTADTVDSGKKQKEVRFVADDRLIRVHPMIAWSHAYRQARKGDWEVLARDSERFRARIASAARVLEPILCQSHRDKIRQQLEKYTNY